MTTGSPRLILIAHNLRSCHNIGSLLRTAEGLGVEEVVLSGYTPYPLGGKDDDRLPHLARKIDRQIHKTALGAENLLSWRHETNISDVLAELRASGWQIAAIEQTENSLPLPEFVPSRKVALIVGREVEGIEHDVLAQTDIVLEIPMFGSKESFNVVQAAAMAFYHCRFTTSNHR